MHQFSNRMTVGLGFCGQLLADARNRLALSFYRFKSSMNECGGQLFDLSLPGVCQLQEG